jgi:gliding motility-associated protein GldE
LLATILLLNNVVNIIIILISTVLAQELFPADSLPVWLQWVIHVFGVTFLIVLFGEVLPKVYATSRGPAVARTMAPALAQAQTLLTPIWKPLVGFGSWMDRRMSTPTGGVSVEVLEQALELTADGDRTAEEQRLLEGIVSLGSKDAKQVMTPRTSMDAVARDLGWDSLRSHILDSGYSRLPVYEGTTDNIVGVLHVKDLVPHLEEAAFDWTPLLRKAYFIPENKKIDDLLRDFQSRRTHLAIVVDEYGGTSGLITLEDIIEEIVGEIEDEFDSDAAMYSRLDERTVLVEAGMSLVDLYRLLDLAEQTWEQAKGESDTIGGFITEQAGRLLRKGESISFSGTELRIDAATPRKLLRIKVTLPEAPASDEAV